MCKQQTLEKSINGKSKYIVMEIFYTFSSHTMFDLINTKNHKFIKIQLRKYTVKTDTCIQIPYTQTKKFSKAMR